MEWQYGVLRNYQTYKADSGISVNLVEATNAYAPWYVSYLSLNNNLKQSTTH